MLELRNNNGEQLFHLRRIGPQATAKDAVDKMDLYKVTSIIGRNAERVDFVIDSSNHVQRMCLSRSHARIVRQSMNQHRLYDDSLNGVFVNNIKIAGSCVLREGDRVTFGHPNGKNLPAGKRERQPESEHQFLFEKCNCETVNQTKTPEIEDTRTKQVCEAEFKVPVASASVSHSSNEKRARRQTLSFTPEDFLHLNEKPNTENPKQMSQEEKCKMEEEIQRNEQEKIEKQREKERCLREKEEEKERLKKLKFEQKKQDKKKEKANLAQIENKLIQMDVDIKRSLQRVGNADIDKCIAVMEDLDQLPVSFAMLQKNPDIMNTIKKCRKYKGSEQIKKKADSIYSKYKQLLLVGDGSTEMKQAWNEKSASSSKEGGSRSCETVSVSSACEDTVSNLSCDDTKANVKITEVKAIQRQASSEEDCNDSSAEVENSASGESTGSDYGTEDTNITPAKHDVIPDNKEQITTKQDSNSSSCSLEVAVESIMQDLATIRNIVESPTRKSDWSDSIVTRPPVTSITDRFRSPTKDACIQTCDTTRSSTPPVNTVVLTHDEQQESVHCVVDESVENKQTECVGQKLSTDNNIDTNVALTDEDENSCEIMSSSSRLSEPSRENPISTNNGFRPMAVTSSEDDTSTVDAFECEFLPKENKVENDIESHDLEENQNNNEKDGFMLSDSIDYDYIEDSSSVVSDSDKTDPDRNMTDEVETNSDKESSDGDEINPDKERSDGNETEPDKGCMTEPDKESINEDDMEPCQENMDDDETESDKESIGGNETEPDKASIYGNKTELDKESIDENETDIDKESKDGVDMEHNQENMNRDETESDKETVDWNETEFDKESIDGNKTELDKRRIDGNEIELDEESIDGNTTELDKASIYGNETKLDKDSIDGNETELDKESIDGVEMEPDQENMDGDETVSNKETVDWNETELDKESINGNEIELDKENIDKNKTELDKESIDGKEIELDKESIDWIKTEFDKESMDGNETELDKESIDENETELDKDSINGNKTELDKESTDENETDKESIDGVNMEPYQENMDGDEAESDKETVDWNETELDKENIDGNEMEGDKESIDRHETKLDKESVYENATELDKESIYGNEKEGDKESIGRNETNLGKDSVYENETNLDKESIYGNETELDKESIYEDETESDQECIYGNDTESDKESVNGNETNYKGHVTGVDETDLDREIKDRNETGPFACDRENQDEDDASSVKPAVQEDKDVQFNENIESADDNFLTAIQRTNTKKEYEQREDENFVKTVENIEMTTCKEEANDEHCLVSNDVNCSRQKRKACDESNSGDEKVNKKKCIDVETTDIEPAIIDSVEYDSIDEGVELLPKKKTLKKRMGNIAGIVKGFFTQRASKKSYDLIGTCGQSNTSVKNGVGQYRILDLNSKKSFHEDNVIHEDNVSKLEPANRNGFTECELKEEDYSIHESDDEEPKTEERHAVQSFENEAKNNLHNLEEELEPVGTRGSDLLHKLLESNFDNKIDVDDEDTDSARDNVIECSAETRVLDTYQEVEQMEDDERDTFSNCDESKDRESCFEIEQIEVKLPNDNRDTADDVDTISDSLYPIPKMPEKLNETVVMSSQLCSPVISKFGTEIITDELDSPVIARQEVVQTALEDDNKSIGDDEDKNNDDGDYINDDKSSNGMEQLSCNFSDEENFDSPDIDFTNLDDSPNEGYASCMDYEDYEYMDTDRDSEYIDSERDSENEDTEDEKEDNDCEEITIVAEEVTTTDSKIQDESEQIETEFVGQEEMETIYDRHSGIEEINIHEEAVDVTVYDSETKTNAGRSRISVKRKCDFDNVDSPKKRKSSTEDDTCIIFKTPLQMKATPKNPEQTDPEDITSTQLLNSTHTPDMNDFTLTQMDEIEEQLENKLQDREKSKPTKSKARDLLAKLRAKKQQREIKIEEDVAAPSPGPSVEAGSAAGSGKVEAMDTDVAFQLDRHVNRCKEVLCQLKGSFDAEAGLRSNPRVVAWRQELAQIEKKLEFPKTVIAVVGDTGAGKSSLMNALLDHRSVLPTSGMRACTAVVVEVVQNTTSKYFEADIEFLQRKEWFDELQVLLRDLTGLDGQVKNRQPDPASDSYVSYCKVRAVYGKIDRFEVLSRHNTVTHWLGRTKVIKSSKPEDFRRDVERYIETQDPGAGGQYWPIVKHVRLRMPNCDVCSSGAALVDLPGVRDSNAARDKIAREYMKNCTAVWVVSSIHRAIDDKTAKDLLGENFRRQLLMDGQYGSIAFICTKTDVLMPSEIIKPLKLGDKTKVHEDKISEMEDTRNDLNLTIAQCVKGKKQLKETIETLHQEVKELKDNLVEIRALLDSEHNDSLTEENEALSEYQDELTDKETEIETSERKIQEIKQQQKQATQKIHELEPGLNFHRRAITAICAKARNEYSKHEIRRDFKAGLKEMKRRAGMLNEEDEEEEEEEESDDEDDDVGSTADNLKVFCCSSTEYQKLKNLLTDDGPAQVFSTMEDTEIPGLRQYVHEMTSVRRQQSLERLVRSLGRYVFDLLSYTTTGSYMHGGDRLGTKSVIESQVQQLDASLAPVLKQLQLDIEVVFDGSIRPKMQEGASNASSEANDTCTKWGAPVNRDPNKDKRAGGLHWATYRATVRRQGVYTSRTYGAVDMNEELSEPMYRSMTIVWDKAFSGMLWRILEKLKSQILEQLRSFVDQLCVQLEQLGVPRHRSGRVGAQLQGSVANKLTEMVNYLKELITDRQRTVSRIVTPTVQESLTPTYTICASECGPGMYMRIKTHMTQDVDQKRVSMFDGATNKLMQALVDLQTEILTYVQSVCMAVLADLRAAFEPLWDTPTNCSMLRSAFLNPVTNACASVREIYTLAGLENTEEKTLVQTGAGISSASAVPTATCTMETLPGGMAIKQEYKNDPVDSYGQRNITVKIEGHDSYSITVPPKDPTGTGSFPIKQERLSQDIPVPGTSKFETDIYNNRSGQYRSILPKAPSSSGIITVAPGVKTSTVKVGSVATPQHCMMAMPPGGKHSKGKSIKDQSSSVMVEPVATPQHHGYDAVTIQYGKGSSTGQVTATPVATPTRIVAAPHDVGRPSGKATPVATPRSIVTVPPGVGRSSGKATPVATPRSIVAVPPGVGRSSGKATPVATPRSIVAVPPGVGRSAGKATPVATQPSIISVTPSGSSTGNIAEPQYGIMRQVPGGLTMIVPVKVGQVPGSEKSVSTCITHDKENSYQQSGSMNKPRGSSSQIVNIKNIKKEPADTGYEKKNRRNKFLGTIDLTID